MIIITRCMLLMELGVIAYGLTLILAGDSEAFHRSKRDLGLP